MFEPILSELIQMIETTIGRLDSTVTPQMFKATLILERKRKLESRLIAFLVEMQNFTEYSQKELNTLSDENLEKIGAFFKLDWKDDRFYDDQGKLNRDQCILSIVIHQWKLETECRISLMPLDQRINHQGELYKMCGILTTLPALLGDAWKAERKPNGEWEIVHNDGYRLGLFFKTEMGRDYSTDILYIYFLLSDMGTAPDGRAENLSHLLKPEEAKQLQWIEFNFQTTDLGAIAQTLLRDRIGKIEELYPIVLERYQDRYWSVPCSWVTEGTLRLDKRIFPTMDDVNKYIYDPGNRHIIEMVVSKEEVRTSFRIDNQKPTF